nr:uncharacterized protein LOC100183904 isoform X2 [Ciona intestinalis]|eukprot:XP_002123268.2 uncharacterized protein LOC100183904 isoform X2 [Ciona intestinalis]
MVCPYFPDSHVFDSVGEVIDVYPAVKCRVYPVTSFCVKVDGQQVEVQAFEELNIIKPVLGSSEDFLEVCLVRNLKHLLLSADLSVQFIQKRPNILGDELIKPEDQKLYNLFELATEIWSPDRRPLRVKFPLQNVVEQNQAAVKKSSLWSMGWKRNKKEGICPSVTPRQRTNELNLIPDTWWSSVMVIEPFLLVDVISTTVTSRNFPLRADLDITVTEMVSTNIKPHCDVISDSPTVALHMLDLYSLLGNSNRETAIVVMVINQPNGKNPLQRSTSCQWVALHSTRKVPKLLMTSQDNQHYLVSSEYNGRFNKVYPRVADVPITKERPLLYIGASDDSGNFLDSCFEGQYVRFFHMNEVTEYGKICKYATCLVLDTPTDRGSPATFPMHLRGEFRSVDRAELRTRDLHTSHLPVTVYVQHQDNNLHFDPLAGKTLTVEKVIEDTVVTLEKILKIDKKLQPRGGAMVEVAAHRSELVFMKTEGTEFASYPRKTKFTNVERLPFVEVLSNRDVADMQNLSFQKFSPNNSTAPLRPPMPKQYLRKCKYSIRRTKKKQKDISAENILAEKLNSITLAKNNSKNKIPPQKSSSESKNYPVPNHGGKFAAFSENGGSQLTPKSPPVRPKPVRHQWQEKPPVPNRRHCNSVPEEDCYTPMSSLSLDKPLDSKPHYTKIIRRSNYPTDQTKFDFKLSNRDHPHSKSEEMHLSSKPLFQGPELLL